MPGNKILLVGERLGRDVLLAKRLASWGGEFQFAASYRNLQSMAGQSVFALVLAELTPGSNSFTELVSLFEHRPTTVYCSYPIEDGCLWIPLLSSGKTCLGEPFLRPSELTRILRRTLGHQCASPIGPDPLMPKEASLAPLKTIPEEFRLVAKAG